MTWHDSISNFGWTFFNRQHMGNFASIFFHFLSFLLERDRPGFTIGRVHDKMGERLANNAELIFQDCFIPDANVVGKVGESAAVFANFSPMSNAYAGASVLGVAVALYEKAVEWAKVRVQGVSQGDLIEGLGGTAVTIPFGEVVPALHKALPKLTLAWVEDKTEVLLARLENFELSRELPDPADIDRELGGARGGSMQRDAAFDLAPLQLAADHRPRVPLRAGQRREPVAHPPQQRAAVARRLAMRMTGSRLVPKHADNVAV